MNPQDYGFSVQDWILLKQPFIPFADKIESVALFGSRAMGRHRRYSDVDIVVFGSLTFAERGQLSSALEESNLPYVVDVCQYKDITHAAFKAHIDAVAIPLWTQAELQDKT